MGWTGEYIYGKFTYAEEKRRIVAQYTWENAGITVRPLMVSNVRPNWYIAVEVIAPAGHDSTPFVAETLADGRIRYVFCEAVLVRKDSKEWCHKEVSESSGPTISDAPKGLIAKLSPLMPEGKTSEWAAEWRARCIAKATAPKLKEGTRIRLASPALFSVGKSLAVWCSEFSVTSYRRRGKNHRAYQALDIGGGLVRLPLHMVAGCEVLA